MSTPTPPPRPALKATGMRRRYARCLETELAAERARLDWLLQDNVTRFDTSYRDRAAIDAAMKEETK